jgi:hypothetical protein
MQDDANSIAYPEAQDGFDLKLKTDEASRLVGEVQLRFFAAQSARADQEKRWIQAYHNFRGLYPKNVKFRDSEKSRVFIKITKTKVIAAFGQLIEVIFGGDKFPIGVKATRVPEGVAQFRHITNVAVPDIESSVAMPEDKELPAAEPLGIGYKGDGEVLKAGATMLEASDIYAEAEEAGLTIIDGPAQTPEQQQYSPAKRSAANMEQLIHDQIEESSGATEVRSALFECTLLGTGIIKGPFNYNKQLHRWVETEEGEREYTPVDIRVPRIEFVSVWDFFPDPSATSIAECEYLIHRHKLNATQVRALQDMPHFNKKALASAIGKGADYLEDQYERELKDDGGSRDLISTKFEVLEYWGVMDASMCKECGLELPKNLEELQELQVNVWTCNGEVLRVVTNPFTPRNLPYHAFPYERNPYSLFGIGVAENMDDSQQIMNGHARMAIDNMALSGSLVFDVDTSMLEHGQSYDVYPGKVFKRQSGMPGQAIHGIKFPNTANENMMMFDKFRQLADEQTGIPSYSHGITGVQSMTRTASGMSMLMGAASLNIKTVVKNLDDFLLKTLGQAYFHWNMQFFEGPLDIKGDLEIHASGTTSLMQKEVRSQRLTTVLQTINNPALAPYVKVSTVLEELAKTLDLDPQEILNSPEEAQIAAQIIGLQNASNGQTAGEVPAPASQQPPAMAGPQGVSQGPPAQGVTGNGNGTIGTGNAPQAGEPEFTGQPPQA